MHITNINMFFTCYLFAYYTFIYLLYLSLDLTGFLYLTHQNLYNESAYLFQNYLSPRFRYPGNE